MRPEPEEKNGVPSKKELEIISELARRKVEEEEVYVFPLVLCDNEIDRDFERFSTKTLEEMAPLYVGKTGIFDHSMRGSDQKARIFQTWVERDSSRKTRPGEPYACLKAKAYMPKTQANQDLILEIETGIKKEVSVGCSVRRSFCSVCGQERQAEPCAHVPGNWYGEKQCHTVLDGAKDAYEWSFVAVPAQPAAGVTKSYQGKEKPGMQTIREVIKSAEGELRLDAGQRQALVREMEMLEKAARAGEDYRNDLVGQAVKLCALALPEMETHLFREAAKGMSLEQIKGFCRAFAEKTGEGFFLQTRPLQKSGKTQDNTPFKI